MLNVGSCDPLYPSMALTVTSNQPSETRLIRGNIGDVLILSMRRLQELVASCILYEFEDVIMDLTGGDCVEVGNDNRLQFSRRAYKLLRAGGLSQRVAGSLAPPPSAVELPHDYDLFIALFNYPHELYALAAVPDWRRHCRVAACFIDELWAHLLPVYLLELLQQFDHIFIGTLHCVDVVGRIVGRPCSYLPLAADVLRFSPWPRPPERSIEVCNIGRRSPVTHAALLEWAKKERLFYYYDTVGSAGFNDKQRTFHVSNPREHRYMLSQLLQRSRYYIANRARINEPQYTGNKEEIPGRYYEGAAAGAVLIGDPPTTQNFTRQFHWQDAVIHMPFDQPNIGGMLAELARDPKRLDQVSRRNVHFAALEHDWVYRLAQMMKTLGLAPLPTMLERERQLQLIAAQAMGEGP
jgi:glycosyl transferase family 1